MPKEQSVQKGMSRAAKRRRKDQTKGVKNSKSESTSDDRANDDNSGDEDDRIVAEDVPEVVEEAEKLASAIDLSPEDIEKLTVNEILVLKDVTEIDSLSKASLLLSTIIYPTEKAYFYSEFWEKRPIHCSSPGVDRRGVFKGLLTKKQFRSIIDSHSISYNVDIDTSKPSKDEQKANENEESNGDDESSQYVEAKPTVLWNQFRDGVTLRLLSPQKFHDPIWRLLSALEFEFGSMVGCHAYHVPAGGKGFAPSYEVHDTIVVQLDGESKWKLYAPQEGQELPRSPLPRGESLQVPSVVSFEATMKPGETLYIPRGWIHQQENCTGDASLSLAIFTNPSNTHVDYLELILPQALADAATSHVELRKSLPRVIHSFMGVASSEDDENPKRKRFTKTAKSLLAMVTEKALGMLDAAADQNAKKFLCDRLPVPLTADEESKTAAGAPSAVIYPYTRLRMVRPGIARGIVEDGMVVVYHCMDNARELHAAPMQPLEYELDDGPAIEALLLAYPEAVTVQDLPHPSEELDDKISVAQSLYKEGFLFIEDEASKPANPDDEDDDDDDPF